ncbi:MAG: hypothetical protein SGI89_13360 [bacterium]|nr:hypothetical protein [bacterium]
MDLFFGCGPDGSTSPDHHYKNLLRETGTATLVRLDLVPLTTDLLDGQNRNFIDYDNDGDLDAYQTNYAKIYLCSPNKFMIILFFEIVIIFLIRDHS